MSLTLIYVYHVIITVVVIIINFTACCESSAVDLPSIDTQPTAKQSIELGGTVSISLEPGPARNLTYEWRKVGGDLPPSRRCKGIHTKELIISDIKKEDVG